MIQTISTLIMMMKIRKWRLMKVGAVTLMMTIKMPNKMMMIRVGKLEEVLIV